MTWYNNGCVRCAFLDGVKVVVAYNNVRAEYVVFIEELEVSTGFGYPAAAMTWIERMIQ